MNITFSTSIESALVRILTAIARFYEFKIERDFDA